LDTNARTAPMAGVSGVEDDENVKTRSGIHHKLDDHDKHFDMGNKNVPTDRRTDKDYSDEYLETQNAAGYKGTDIDGMEDNRSDHDLLGRDANDTMDEGSLTSSVGESDKSERLRRFGFFI